MGAVNVCPKCGCPSPVHFWHCPDHPEAFNYMLEVERLKAALSQDEHEIVLNHRAIRGLTEQRDEARRWAKYLHRLVVKLCKVVPGDTPTDFVVPGFISRRTDK